METFTDDHHCFVCGQENAQGLGLRFRRNALAREAEADLQFPPHLQGWQGVVHGGLLATVLDEAMVQAAMAGGTTCVTAEITVKYRQPALTGTPYGLSAKVVATKGRIITAESRICDARGQIFAQASGKLFRIS
jgi:uncharacterized protein (TIGR00369 family)